LTDQRLKNLLVGIGVDHEGYAETLCALRQRTGEVPPTLRDYLRADAAAREAYLMAKMALADRWRERAGL
jgi:GrpB-like predicted nucleotidyltransferase (UPF0157 family)